MLFNSYVFIFAFVPLVLLGLHTLERRGHPGAGRAWLVLASLVFYGWWDVRFLGLLIPSILVNYAIGRWIAARRDRDPRGARAGLWVGVVLDLSVIGFFKYFNFFAGSVAALSGGEHTARAIVLPLGISFFTFQQIAYLVDVYRGLDSGRGFVKYAVFVSFFPQLVAGPIVHHKTIIPQMDRPRFPKGSSAAIAFGLTIFMMGLFKKVVFADNLAGYATPVFAAADAGEALSALEAWLGVLAYTFQIYFDFSGYSDMAIGLAEMMGFRLPINFDSPYKSRSIVEFWRRWHITLSEFLRDYLYFPLGGNRKGPTRRHVNLLITMLLGGLWHGAGWTFVAWGGLHGAYLVVNHLWRQWRGDEERHPIASQVLTFLCVVVAWVFFRAETFAGAWALIGSMFRAPHGWLARTDAAPFALLGDPLVAAWIVAAAAVAFAMPSTLEWSGWLTADSPRRASPRPSLRWQWRPTLAWAVAFGIAMGLAILQLPAPSEFIYFQF
jgi:D-alanyl-lipoteichoic acid acyltransferase DltB (MBOAT superfamily)